VEFYLDRTTIVTRNRKSCYYSDVYVYMSTNKLIIFFEYVGIIKVKYECYCLSLSIVVQSHMTCIITILYIHTHI